MIKYGYCREQEGLESLPSEVRRAAECLGWQALCDATNTEVVRAQFTKAYESLETRAAKQELLPPALQGKMAALVESITRPVGIGCKSAQMYPQVNHDGTTRAEKL